MKRLLALVLALALVGGAFLVRDRLTSADDGSGSRPAEAGDDDAAGPLQLVCATEVSAACTALAAEDDRIALVVEPAGVTTDRLVDAATDPDDPGFDAWLVPEPWPRIVSDERSREGLPALLRAAGDPSPVLARSPLVLAVWDDRAAVLGGVCGGEPTWRCLGDVAGQRWDTIGGSPAWGPVKPGHDAPDRSARGLAVLGQAVTSYFGRSDLASNDLADPAFESWFARLERAVPTFSPSAGSAFEQMLVVGPASFDAVGTTESQAGPLLARSPARAQTIALLYPSPVATLDLVLAVPEAPGAAEEAERLAEIVGGEAGAAALAASGWRVEGQPPAEGVADTPALPATTNLPPAGTMEAIRRLWVEVVG